MNRLIGIVKVSIVIVSLLLGILSPIIVNYMLSGMSLDKLSDIYSSFFLGIALIFAVMISLTNLNILPRGFSHRLIRYTTKMPSSIPFNKPIKKYLLSILKIDFKVIVFLRTMDYKNYEVVLNQIGGYNSVLKEAKIMLNNGESIEVELVFIDNKSDDIGHYFNSLDTYNFNYIFITTLSDIFKQTIKAREALSVVEKNHIEIIGALSSISNSVQHLIDIDDNIIRVFPPDYDEAQTAIDFIMSKIKSSICSDSTCRLHDKKNNIIILHNGTYGESIKEQCEVIYKKELNNIYNNTHKKISPLDLEKHINFFSFDYLSNGEMIYDKIYNNQFASYIDEWDGDINYFFIVGYEPNLSSILNFLDKALENNQDISICMLFCGTTTLKKWRASVIKTLENRTSLKALATNAYYLKLIMGNVKQTPFIGEDSKKLALKLSTYRQGNSIEFSLKKELLNILGENKKINEEAIEKLIHEALNNKESYIRIFSNLSILIAKHRIENRTSLIKSKEKILENYQDKVDMRINGDSVNNYRVFPIGVD